MIELARAAACAEVCKNGACTATNDCACAPGWQGRDCSIPICPEPCRNGGTCARPKQCSCPPGFSGPTCAINLSAGKAVARSTDRQRDERARADQARGAFCPAWRRGEAAAAAAATAKSPGAPEKTVRLVYGEAPDVRGSTSWAAAAWAAATSAAGRAQGWLRRAFLALRKGFAGSRAASADAADEGGELVWTVEDVRVGSHSRGVRGCIRYMAACG